MRVIAALMVAATAMGAHADALSAAQDLGVTRLTLQDLDPVEARDGSGVMISIEMDGREVVLDLAPKSFRSDSFTLVLAGDNGERIEVAAPPPSTYRGTIAGDPTTVVAGSIIDGEANLMIVTDEGTWSVQPVPAEGEGIHAIYSERDVIPHEGVCIVPEAGEVPNVMDMLPKPTFAMRGTEGEFRVAEIAIEADWRLFNTYFGQNQTALLNDIDSVIAGLSAIYERDVLLTYELTHVLIRTTSASDPYTTNDPSGLLGQFQSWWNTNQGGIPRDVAHLWTGRNMSGSTIGIAYLGVICTQSAYGADQIRFSGNFNSRVGLFSHELGHNWNAPHCDGTSSCRIMCSGLGGCSGLGNPVRFGPNSIETINSYISGRPCIDNLGVDLPIFENFEDQTLEPPAWSGSVGFDVVFDASGPSGVWVGEFSPPFTSITTAPMETDVPAGSTVAVDLYLEPSTASAGNLRLNVRDESNSNVRMADIPAHNPTEGYRRYSFQLPGSVLGLDTPLSIAPTGNDEWRIDDVHVRAVSASGGQIGLPFAEGFELGGLELDNWQPSMGDVNSGAAESGSYSLALDAGQRLETADASAAGEDEVVFGAMVRRPANPAGDAEIVVEYRNSSGTWIEADRVSAETLPASDFSLIEVIVAAGVAHNDLSFAFEIVGGASDEAWRIDDIEMGGEPRGTADCPADLAEPFGVLDLGDIGAFVAAFGAGDLLADLAAPFGVLDLGDVSAFTQSFVAGCP